MQNHVIGEAFIDMFAQIGSGLWHTQNVENALHTYVAFKDRIKERGRVSQTEAEAIINSIAKKPLGKVVGISEAKKVLSIELQERVTAFNVERRWFIHWSVVEKGHSFILDSRHWDFMDRVTRYTEEALTLYKEISSEYEEFVVSKGVSREFIELEAGRRLRAMYGEEV